MSDSPIDRAIRIAGGQRQLGQALGVSYQAVQKFRHRIPAERVLQIESVTGIPRHELRPDLYPRDDRAA